MPIDRKATVYFCVGSTYEFSLASELRSNYRWYRNLLNSVRIAEKEGNDADRWTGSKYDDGTATRCSKFAFVPINASLICVLLAETLRGHF